MKLLFDQNLSPKLIKHLADLYPDSNHVYHLVIDLAPGKEMREYAAREGFVIVTKDADFSDLCILLGFPPKVIWIRRGNCSSEDIESILRNHHADIEALDQDQVMGDSDVVLNKAAEAPHLIIASLQFLQRFSREIGAKHVVRLW